MARPSSRSSRRHKGPLRAKPGATMVIAHDGVRGSIGGGHLEFEALRIARDALATPTTEGAWIVRFPLAARLGQCCGGVATLAFSQGRPARANLGRRRAGVRTNRRTVRASSRRLGARPATTARYWSRRTTRAARSATSRSIRRRSRSHVRASPGLRKVLRWCASPKMTARCCWCRSSVPIRFRCWCSATVMSVARSSACSASFRRTCAGSIRALAISRAGYRKTSTS